MILDGPTSGEIPAQYEDPLNGTSYDLSIPRWRSDQGTPLRITKRTGISKNEVDTSIRSLWRYQAAFPLQIQNPITLGEGCTPLIEVARGKGRPLFKLEWFSPSGSFKDRGTSVMMSYLKEHGVSAVHEDSSGNAGSSVACYGAAGNMDVTIYVPSNASGPKVTQIKNHGANIVLIDGPRENAREAAMSDERNSFYASHAWQPFFTEGQKTLAYEIWEDLGFQAPDNVVIAVGEGTALLGCFIGFSELLAAGQISKMPRLHAAQPLNCSPLDAALRGEPGRPILPTIAEGTFIANPIRMRNLVIAIRGTRGTTIAIEESKIVEAYWSLAESGFSVEPTSATAVAAYDQLLESKTIAETDKTVVVLGGAGLKAAAPSKALL